MKVEKVERIVVDVPFTERQQRIAEREVYNWAILELCKVTADTGHVGWGETVLHYTWQRVSDAAVERVVGSSPAEHLNDDSLGSGLQMALHDLVGHILEVPVHSLLEGVPHGRYRRLRAGPDFKSAGCLFHQHAQAMLKRNGE